MAALSKARRRFLRFALSVSAIAAPVYFLGVVLREEFLFGVGLAILIFGLTMLGNVLFQTLWVEEKERL